MRGTGSVPVCIRTKWLAVALFGVLAFSFLGTGIVHAQDGAVIEVNSLLDDQKSNDGICTLREAIISANKDKSGDKDGECATGSGNDTILVPPGRYLLSRSDNGNEDASTTGDLDITSNIVISPTGPGLVVIDASGISGRVFHILGGNSVITGVTILSGTVSGNGGGVMVEAGAAISLTNVTLTGNTATGSGGGIYVDGKAVLTNVTVKGNHAAGGTAVAAGTGNLVLRNTIIDGGSCVGSVSSISVEGANLIHNAPACPTGTSSANPQLLPWSGDNIIYALSAGSPAVDAASNELCPATDQRGVVRPQGLGCDIGAFELRFPAAVNDVHSTLEDETLTVAAPGVLGNDSGGETGPTITTLTAVKVTDPAHGALTLNGDGSFVYTPADNYYGPDSFTYKADYGSGTTNVATVSITVAAVNDAPEAVADAYSTDEDVPLSSAGRGLPGLLNNDKDVDSSDLDVSSYTQPANGDVTVDLASGAFVYTPDPHFSGTDSFTYIVTDKQAVSPQAGTVTIAVAPDGYIEVTTCQDSGAGSLRWAIELANQQPNVDTIIFDILDPACTEPYTIFVGSPLPNITAPVIIDGTLRDDGTSQPAGTITLDGGGGSYDGLVLGPGSGGSTIKGLVIQNFGGSGIRIQGSPGGEVANGGNTIAGNTITGNGGNGITIVNSVNNQLVENNIHGNLGLPIDLGDDGPTVNDPGDGDTGANNVQNYPELIRASAIPAGTVSTASADADPDTLQIVGTLNSSPGSYELQFFVSQGCNTGEQTLLNPVPLVVTIPAGSTEVGFNANIGVTGNVLDLLGYSIRAIATDSNGNSSEANNCIHVSYPNDIWPSALDLSTVTPPISQYLDRLGQSRWYKIKIAPNSKIKFDLTGLAQDYNLAIYKDVESAYLELASGEQNLNELGAEVASDPLNPSAATADAFRTAQTAGSALNGSALNGSALNGSALNGSALNGSALNGSALNGSALNGSALNGSALNGSALNALVVNGSALNGSALNGSALNAEELARVNSSALARTLIAVSASEGTSPEGVEINSWNNTGYLYVRVWGNEGAFDPLAAFTFNVTTTTGLCDAVANAQLPATSLSATGSTYQTVILADWSRMLANYTADDVSALQAKLAALAAEPSVQGVIVDVGADARVAAANALADTNPDCSYAKNLVAESIQTLVDAYRSQNPVKYVVIVGNDDIIPFYRYPDNALLGPEAQYYVPNRFGTSSYASLRENYLLSQDQYGASTCISVKDNCFPIPDLAVGRLVEAPRDIMAVLDAYLNGGQVLTPNTALVTGYDFLEDASNAIRDHLSASVGVVDGELIDPQIPGPLQLAEEGKAWTATDLIGKLNYNPGNPDDVDFDLMFLAGHFSSAGALAGDYKTTMLTTDLPTVMTNKLIYSAGCHSGYNSVNWHNIPGTTLEPDWAQAFAQRGATFIGGTGYQYGDTDFLEYSERLYLYFTEELRTLGLDQSGQPVVTDIAIGDAMVAAKQRYLAETPLLRGIHEKSLLVSTIFGLPMLKVNLPNGRITPAPDVSVITNDKLVNTGNALGLRVAPYTLNPSLQFRPEELKRIDDPTQVINSGYWVGDGVVTNPGEPVVPLEIVNVSSPQSSLALRGVGLVGGCYADELLPSPTNTPPNRIPLTGAPTTEASSAHIQFYSDSFVPEQPWSENYFGALFDSSSGGSTYLNVMPVQYRSSVNSLAQFEYTERKFGRMDFRLYYNDAITSDPAHLAPPPTIVNVASTYSEANGANFQIRVAGDTNAGIHEVWVLYTGVRSCAEPPGGMSWEKLDLAANAADPALWEGHLDLPGLNQQSVTEKVRFIVFAAGGSGAVSWATNRGMYYVPGGDLQRETTSLTLNPPPKSTGAVGTTVAVSAVLKDSNGSPLPGRSIVFGLAQQPRVGVTDGNGVASVQLPIFGVAGNYGITASFAGSAEYAPSTANPPQPFTIVQQSTLLALASGESDPDENAALIATLVDGTAPDPNILVEQTVFFYFTNVIGGETFTRTAITGLLGEARLGRDGVVSGIPRGTYNVLAEFKGSPSYTASTAADTVELGVEPTGLGEEEQPPIRLFLPSISSDSSTASRSAARLEDDPPVHLPLVSNR